MISNWGKKVIALHSPYFELAKSFEQAGYYNPAVLAQNEMARDRARAFREPLFDRKGNIEEEHAKEKKEKELQELKDKYTPQIVQRLGILLKENGYAPIFLPIQGADHFRIRVYELWGSDRLLSLICHLYNCLFDEIYSGVLVESSRLKEKGHKVDSSALDGIIKRILDKRFETINDGIIIVKYPRSCISILAYLPDNPSASEEGGQYTIVEAKSFDEAKKLLLDSLIPSK